MRAVSVLASYEPAFFDRTPSFFGADVESSYGDVVEVLIDENVGDSGLLVQRSKRDETNWTENY